jgi:hypothetical protein
MMDLSRLRVAGMIVAVRGGHNVKAPTRANAHRIVARKMLHHAANPQSRHATTVLTLF